MKAALYGFTDYPFTDLGDVPFEIAPVRSCKVLSYDGDKYVNIEVAGTRQHIKRFYIYPRRGRCGETPSFSMRKLADLRGNLPDRS